MNTLLSGEKQRRNSVVLSSCFTFSYVWGASSPKDNGKRRDIQRRRKLPLLGLPRVVGDALAVVKNLGKRYLWVDKYCIYQYDSDIRHYQIQNMDLI